MFVSQSPAPTPFGAITTLRVVSLAERTFHAAADFRRRHRTKMALASLTDGQLADIGLHRGQIEGVANGLIRR